MQTTIGPVQGFVDPSFPRVRQWLGVPFAEPPVGHRRFAPPEAKRALPPRGDKVPLSATTMPPAPVQARTTKPDFYTKHVPEFLARGPYSEDCLYLNVFAPRADGSAEEGDVLPTLVFFYGGEGEWGGINAEYSQSLDWVERSQRHIVVLFKYVPPPQSLRYSSSHLSYLSYSWLYADIDSTAGEWAFSAFLTPKVSDANHLASSTRD